MAHGTFESLEDSHPKVSEFFKGNFMKVRMIPFMVLGIWSLKKDDNSVDLFMFYGNSHNSSYVSRMIPERLISQGGAPLVISWCFKTH